MRAWAAALFFLASTFATANANPAPLISDVSFDYEGIALDASLGEVSAMHAPDDSAWRLACQADDYFGPQVEKCTYRDRAGRIGRLRFDHTARHSDDHIFYFAADRVDGTLRLFEIMLIGTAQGRTREAIIAGFRHDIVAGLTARFGAPQEDHAVANSVGFEPGNLDALTRWRRAQGTVEVSGPNQSEWGLDRTLRVTYTDPDLASRAYELRQQWQNTRPRTP